MNLGQFRGTLPMLGVTMDPAQPSALLPPRGGGDTAPRGLGNGLSTLQPAPALHERLVKGKNSKNRRQFLRALPVLGMGKTDYVKLKQMAETA